jgi:hypothetical protein
MPEAGKQDPRPPRPSSAPEREHDGPLWSPPYFAYILLTLALFLFLVVMAWLGLKYGWIPSRGAMGGASSA